MSLRAESRAQNAAAFCIMKRAEANLPPRNEAWRSSRELFGGAADGMDEHNGCSRMGRSGCPAESARPWRAAVFPHRRRISYASSALVRSMRISFQRSQMTLL